MDPVNQFWFVGEYLKFSWKFWLPERFSFYLNSKNEGEFHMTKKIFWKSDHLQEKTHTCGFNLNNSKWIKTFWWSIKIKFEPCYNTISPCGSLTQQKYNTISTLLSFSLTNWRKRKWKSSPECTIFRHCWIHSKMSHILHFF